MYYVIMAAILLLPWSLLALAFLGEQVETHLQKHAQRRLAPRGPRR